MKAVVLLLVMASTAYAQQMTVYSYQNPAGGPRGAHVWAVFEQGNQTVAISFMCLADRPPLIRRAPGLNWNHLDTLAYAHSVGAEVRAIGPMPCSPALFGRAQRRKAALESGHVDYKFVALMYGGRRANCIAAVAQVSGRPFTAGTVYGHRAAIKLATHLLERERH